MSTRCPSCENAQLHPVRLEHDLPALGCPTCGGALLALVSYRNWREHSGPAQAAAQVAPPGAVANSESALRCPKCTRFMTKYRFAADTRNQLDLCSHCDEVWLDDGEWELLESFAIADKLTHVFGNPWQTRVRTQEVQRRAEERWKEKLGDDYERAREIRTWLESHPLARDVLAYLYLSQT
jgi:Zn-finger nucleic acid-binding protein